MNLHQDDGKECQEFAVILGASWGNKDFTKEIADRYNKGDRLFDASHESFGKVLADGTENLTIVSKRCGNVAVKVAPIGE